MTAAAVVVGQLELEESNVVGGFLLSLALMPHLMLFWSCGLISSNFDQVCCGGGKWRMGNFESYSDHRVSERERKCFFFFVGSLRGRLLFKFA